MIWVFQTRIIATFAVVFLHVAAGVLNRVPRTDVINWWGGNVYDSLVRWSVPVFVMISGYLLLGPEKIETLSDFYRKRLSKILWPLLFWTVFYLGWTALRGVLRNEPVALTDLMNMVLSGMPYYHMWYLYMIITLYLFTPFIRKLVNALTLHEAIVLCSLLFLMTSVTYAANIFTESPPGLFISSFLLYLPYYLAGHIFSRLSTQNPRFYIHAIVFTLSVVATALGYYHVEHGLYFYGYISITVIPMSLSLFWIFWSSRKLNTKSRYSSKLSDLSFGIYLIHPVFIGIFRYFGLDASHFLTIVSIPLITLLVFILSAIVALIISSIPRFNKVI
jgi:surface polysaccharide O-acyltransferase-like enzyme